MSKWAQSVGCPGWVILLNHFMPLASFYPLWKYGKNSGFLKLLGGIEKDQWHEMG